MEIENKIYSIAEMRELAIFTADYCFMDAPCTVVGTLLLKAQARRKMFRLFFRLEDESKIIISPTTRAYSLRLPAKIGTWKRSSGDFSAGFLRGVSVAEGVAGALEHASQNRFG